MLGQFSGKHETNCGLNFATAQGGLFVVSGQFTSFGGNAFKNVVDKRVHDRHALFGNARIWMNLLQDLVNVRRVRLGTFLVLGRLAGGGLLGSLGGGLLGRCFGHVVDAAAVLLLLSSAERNGFYDSIETSTPFTVPQEASCT